MNPVLKECLRLTMVGFAYTIGIALAAVIAVSFYAKVLYPLGIKF